MGTVRGPNPMRHWHHGLRRSLKTLRIELRAETMNRSLVRSAKAAVSPRDERRRADFRLPWLAMRCVQAFRSGRWVGRGIAYRSRCAKTAARVLHARV